MSKDIKIPKGEIAWERIQTKSGSVYLVTSKPARDFYYLYLVDDGKLKKIGKAATPAGLRKYYEEEE